MRRGLSLAETLVVVGLFSLLGVAMVAFYRSASVEFAVGSTRMATSQHGRLCLQKVLALLGSAVPRRPLGQPDAFYRPDMSELLTEMEYVDFLSNGAFIANGLPEVVYAFDKALPAAGYSNLFRYRIVWTGAATGDVPANSVYLERLELDPLQPTLMANTVRRILARNIHSCRFRRTTYSSLQLTVNVYGEDPQSGRLLDGSLTRGLDRQRRNVLFHLTSAVPLPALTLMP